METASAFGIAVRKYCGWEDGPVKLLNGNVFLSQDRFLQMDQRINQTCREVSLSKIHIIILDTIGGTKQPTTMQCKAIRQKTSRKENRAPLWFEVGGQRRSL